MCYNLLVISFFIGTDRVTFGPQTMDVLNAIESDVSMLLSIQKYITYKILGEMFKQIELLPKVPEDFGLVGSLLGLIPEPLFLLQYNC